MNIFKKTIFSVLLSILVMGNVNADKIRIVDVDIGKNNLQIICGAWNFNTNDKVAVAVPGASISKDFNRSR